MAISIWWIRRDLRLADNQALSAACAGVGQVIPVFILEPTLLRSQYAGEKRQAFLFDGLRSLDADLHRIGSYLVLRRGEPAEELMRLMGETGAGEIYAEADHSPYARSRDARVANQLPLHLLPGLTLHAPGAVVKADGSPYTVFTPFCKAWKNLPTPASPLAAPERLSTPPGIPGEEIPHLPGVLIPFTAGEQAACRRLEEFLSAGIQTYGVDRNYMDLEGTSGLSPYLRFGMLSARQAVHATWRTEANALDPGSRQGAETWLNELIWREFYINVLFHFPRVRRGAFRQELNGVRWLNNEEDFSAWAEGRTGFPVVDAAMRQLTATGWMHNRARMITASFLTKDLLVDWRWGERFFMQHLVDGDPAANNGGWQWSAGTGTDAAPYFRVFNPVLQGKKFDPRGAYVRRWVPELVKVPDAYIHTPWEMPVEVAQALGFKLGETYPAPIVDHALARQRVLAAYRV